MKEKEFKKEMGSFEEDTEEIEEIGEYEEETEEFNLDDILAEEDLKVDSSRLHQFLMSQNNKSSLNQKEIVPIINLEKELPPIRKENNSREDEQIEYTQNNSDSLPKYDPKDNEVKTYLENKISSESFSEKDLMESNKKSLYSSVQNISSEIAFVQKSTKPEYVPLKRFEEEDFLKEKKRTEEKVFDKIKENYK